MNDMKVSTRLSWSFGLLIALMALICGVAMTRLAQVNDALDGVVNNRTPTVEALDDMAYRVMDNARLAREIVLLTD